MKKIIVGFLVLLASILLGYLIKQDPGYVMVYYRQWSVSSSLWVGLLAVVLFLMILHMLLRIIRGTFSLPSTCNQWYKKSQQKKAWSLTNEALCRLIQNEWRQAEKIAAKASRNNATALVDYLSDAYSAFQLGELQRTNLYLSKAITKHQEAYEAITTFHIQLLIKSAQLQQAKSMAITLQSKASSPKIALRLITEINQQQGEWENIKNHLPLLKKHKCFRAEKLDHLEKQAYLHDINQSALHDNADLLDENWQSLPRSLKKNSDLIAAYAKALIMTKQIDTANQLITDQLKKQWNSQLALLLPELTSDTPANHLLLIEKWHDKYPDDIDLLTVLTELAIKTGFTAKAEHFSHQIEATNPPASILKRLGDLYYQQQDTKKALAYYQKALTTKNNK